MMRRLDRNKSKLNKDALVQAGHFSNNYGSWLAEVESFRHHGKIFEDSYHHLLYQMSMIAERERKPAFERTKWLLDFWFAAALLLMLLPLLSVCAVAILCDCGGPIFFKQLRAGKNGVPFWIWKFRTMAGKADEKIAWKANDPLAKPLNNPRSTRVGSFLREWKLDELPQLINVVRGEMALVGPRPLILAESSTIARKYWIRFAVRPGLTGLWQATIPSDSSGPLKLRLDRIYVKRRSISLDLKLLARTLLVVMLGESGFKRHFVGQRPWARPKQSKATDRKAA